MLGDNILNGIGTVIVILIAISGCSGCIYCIDKSSYKGEYYSGNLTIYFSDGSDTTINDVHDYYQWGGSNGGLLSNGWADDKLIIRQHTIEYNLSPVIVYQLSAIKTMKFQKQYKWTKPYHFWHTKNEQWTPEVIDAR